MIYDMQDAFDETDLQLSCQAHIPLEMPYKQHEIDMPNANLTQKLPNTTIFHRLTLGFCVVLVGVRIGVCVGFVRIFGYQG